MPMTDDLRTRLQQRFLGQADALRGFILGLAGGDWHLTEDVFQEVFLVVDRRAADFRPDGDFAAWTRGIALRTLLAARRRRGHDRVFDERLLDTLAARAPEVDSWSDHLRAMRCCIASLPARGRQLIELRHLDDLPPPAIARRVGWSLNAVHVALSRLRRRLRRCVAARMREGLP
jgi:RNA polymerase sigma-70 factor (ECF subfamily)